jgi:hypothetical protein
VPQICNSSRPIMAEQQTSKPAEQQGAAVAKAALELPWVGPSCHALKPLVATVASMHMRLP